MSEQEIKDKMNVLKEKYYEAEKENAKPEKLDKLFFNWIL